jgi:hypothetical protein
MNWISSNKDWLFSGLGVFILGVIVSAIVAYRKKLSKNVFNHTNQPDKIVQTHNGIGDNIGNDKINFK